MIPYRQQIPELLNMDNSTLSMNLLWMETALRFYAENTQVQEILRIQAVLTGQAKLQPVTGIEVFETARTLVIEVHVPPQQPRNSKSWVCVDMECIMTGTPVTPDPKRLVSGPCWNLYLLCQLFESRSPCCCHDAPCEQQWTHGVFRSVEEL